MEQQVILYPAELSADVCGVKVTGSSPTELYVNVIEVILKRYPGIIGSKETHFTCDSARAEKYSHKGIETWSCLTMKYSGCLKLPVNTKRSLLKDACCLKAGRAKHDIAKTNPKFDMSFQRLESNDRRISNEFVNRG